MPSIDLGPALAEALACVRCGACLTACPTYVLSANEAEGPRGRLALARALHEGTLPLTPDIVVHEDNCLVCDACTRVCPAGVHMEPLQLTLRAAVEPHRRRSAGGRFGRWLALDVLFRWMTALRLVVRLLWLYQRSGLQALARATGLLRVLGLARLEAALPSLPMRFVTPGWAPRAGGKEPVAFFAGCVMSTALAETDRATLRVLERAGLGVDIPPGQGCCGALHAHSGDLAGARRQARAVVAAFEPSDPAPVVVNAAGCGAFLKEYRALLADDPALAKRARRFAARVRDLSEVLADRPLLMARSVAGPAVYQDACHLLHAQGIHAPPRALLARVPGLECREMDEPGLCCGSAGVYNLTHPETANRLADRKLDAAARAGAEVLITANPGCLLHLRVAAHARRMTLDVRHLADVLDEASRP